MKNGDYALTSVATLKKLVSVSSFYFEDDHVIVSFVERRKVADEVDSIIDAGTVTMYIDPERKDDDNLKGIYSYLKDEVIETNPQIREFLKDGRLKLSKNKFDKGSDVGALVCSTEGGIIGVKEIPKLSMEQLKFIKTKIDLYYLKNGNMTPSEFIVAIADLI